MEVADTSATSAPSAPAESTPSAPAPSDGGSSQATSLSSSPASTPVEQGSGTPASEDVATDSPQAQSVPSEAVEQPSGDAPASEEGVTENVTEQDVRDAADDLGISLPDDFDLTAYLRQQLPDEYRDDEHLVRLPDGGVYNGVKDLVIGAANKAEYINKLEADLSQREESVNEWKEKYESSQSGLSEHEQMLQALYGELGIDSEESLAALTYTFMPEEYRGKKASDFDSPEERDRAIEARGEAKAKARAHLQELKAQQEAQEKAQAERIEKGTALYEEKVQPGLLGAQGGSEQYAEGKYLDGSLESGIPRRDILREAYTNVGEDFGDLIAQAFKYDFLQRLGKDIPLPDPKGLPQGDSDAPAQPEAQEEPSEKVQVTEERIDSKPTGSSRVAAEKGISRSQLAKMKPREVMDLAIKQATMKRRR